MTLSTLLATVFVDAACDLCGQPKRVYPDPCTDGRVCLDCLEMLCQPLPEDLSPEDLSPEVTAFAEEWIAARRAAIID